MVKIFSTMSLIIAISALIASIFALNGRMRVGVVDAQRLVLEFDGMKDAEKRLSNLEMLGRYKLDSIRILMVGKANEIKNNGADGNASKEVGNDYLRLESDYNSMRQQFEAQYSNEQQNIQAQVGNQVDSFAREYGEKNGFDIILTTNNGGGVLFGNPGLDITEEFITFINGRYAGK